MTGLKPPVSPRHTPEAKARLGIRLLAVAPTNGTFNLNPVAHRAAIATADLPIATSSLVQNGLLIRVGALATLTDTGRVAVRRLRDQRGAA